MKIIAILLLCCFLLMLPFIIMPGYSVLIRNFYIERYSDGWTGLTGPHPQYKKIPFNVYSNKYQLLTDDRVTILDIGYLGFEHPIKFQFTDQEAYIFDFDDIKVSDFNFSILTLERPVRTVTGIIASFSSHLRRLVSTFVGLFT